MTLESSVKRDNVRDDSLLPINLRCEFAQNPLGIDRARPGLSWGLHSPLRNPSQSAYQIFVASTDELLSENNSDLWDSGRVTTNQTLDIPYQGRPLQSSERVYWKVRAWDRDGKVSPWSQTASWEMGLLSSADWEATWINDGKPNPTNDEDFYREDPAPMFRREFVVRTDLLRARLHISGLGYYEASLNGNRVGDHVLDPGWTRYSSRVLYSTYDVTQAVRPGVNCLGVMLGRGWYNPLPLRMWGHLNLREHVPVGRPRFIARLELTFADGSQQVITSDPDWKVGRGPIRFDSIYLGEVYDARLEVPGWDGAGFDDSAWSRAGLAGEVVGEMRSQSQPPIRVIGKLHPVSLTEPSPGVFIFDMGQNFTGWVNLKVSAPAGTKIVLRYGELLHPDGTLNPMTSVAGQIKGTRTSKDGHIENIGGPGAPLTAWQTDTYIARGGGVESYTPRFTFHAFRYVEVTGLPGQPTLEMLTGLRLSSDVQRVGSFSCSDEQFNRIQTMCDQTFLSNLMSVQSDCPHRERFGYGGDLAVTSEALMMNYDMTGFYSKSVCDLTDSVHPDGRFTDTAPYVGLQYCGIGWAMAHPLVLSQLRAYYGCAAIVGEQYEPAKRWLDTEAADNPGLIVQKGLSDHEAPAPGASGMLVTPLFATSARLIGELAAALDRDADAQRYQQLAREIQSAWVAQFLEPSTGKVGTGTQAAQAFALYLDMVPASHRPAVLKCLVDQLRDKPDGPSMTTGIFGTKFLIDVLSREGHAELAAELVAGKTFPGWGHMLENGATTLWEHWEYSDNTYSHNHPMFGSVSQWFYQWLGGIQPAPETVGFAHVVIRPQVPKLLNWVNCRYESVRGPIISRWRRSDDGLELAVTIPANTSATIYVPACEGATVRESGQPVDQANGVTLIGRDERAVVCRVGGGEYTFAVC
ncbi:MAG: Bacterial alpha-L-rhamnosidase [Phycisphaera sp.]|nr:Bacterial alpha-L-rhamnosidase [Phycisphaera sp.]